LKLDENKIKFGFEGATSDFSKFIDDFKRGRSRRMLPPDDYREQMKLDNFRANEYFSIKLFTLN